MKTHRFLLPLVMAITNSCHSQPLEDDIVLINVGDYNKGRIAELISKINTLKPRVISLDIAFPEYTGDTDDKSLYQALRDSKRLILPSEISSEGEDYEGREIISVHLTCAAQFFVPYAKTGFVSAKVEKGQTQIPRKFIVWQKGSYSDDIYHHFSVVTAMAFDSLKALRFISHNERLAEISYGKKRKFMTFSASHVLNGRLTRRDIEDKIVIFGFLGPGVEDKFFSPVTKDLKSPDMYGVEYLANIVAQVLESK
jgi:CHASE2 domain-containing sensor protein